MADTLLKISDLTETTTAADSDYIPVDDGTTTKKIKVENFNGSATSSAQAYAEAAEASAEDAESWAKGTRNGVNVTSDDPAYENNAKHYATQAANSATLAQTASENVQGYVNTAQNAADAASSAADTCSEGVSQITGAVAQAGVYATQATTAAENAAQSAHEARYFTPEGYQALRDEVAGLDSDVTDLSGDVSDLSGNLTALSGDVDDIETDLASVKQTLSGEVSARTSADALLQTQIDELVAPSGEAPSAAEVQNARIGADGVTYSTLGEAIRTQVGDLQKTVDTVNEGEYNIFPTIVSDWESGLYGNSNEDFDKYDSAFAIRVKNPVSITKHGVYSVNVNGDYRIKVRAFTSSDVAQFVCDTWKTDSFYLTLYDDISYLLIHVGKKNGGYVTLADLADVNISICYRPELSITNVNDYIYSTTDASGDPQQSDVRMLSDYIEVYPSTVYHLKCNTDYQAAIVEYDSDKNYITGFAYYSDHNIELSTNARYIRYVVKRTSNDAAGMVPSLFNVSIDRARYKRLSEHEIISYTTWENGSIDDTTGEEVNNQWSGTRLRSDFILSSSKLWYSYVIGSDYTICAYMYDIDKNYITCTPNWYGLSSSGVFSGFEGYIRFVMKTSNGGYLSPTNVAVCGISVREHYDNLINSVNSKKLTIMTNNIGKFSYGTASGYDGDDAQDKITAWLEMYDEYTPDILGLQEMYPYFNRSRTISSRYDIFNKAFNISLTGVNEEAVMSNQKIVSQEIGLIDSTPTSNARGYIHTEVDVDGTIVNFFNVHLSPDATARATQITNLVSIMNQYSNVICTGDFNAGDSSEYDPFTTAGYVLANCGDFGNFATYIYNSEPLDNIIVSPNIRILDVKMHSSAITSDHKPLIAEILLPILN